MAFSAVTVFLGGTMENRNTMLKKLILSAVMIAVGTVLSLFKFQGLWVLGGGVTFCAMLPLVYVSYRYGVRWGFVTAFSFSLLQVLLGMDNIQYATSFPMALLIILGDYLVAYSVIGFSGLFRNRIKNRPLSILSGIWLTFFARFFCHFLTGWFIWDALWPNEMNLLPPVYSFCYNGSYMLPETILTSILALILDKVIPKKYIEF